MSAKDLTTREWINALIEPGHLLVWALRCKCDNADIPKYCSVTGTERLNRSDGYLTHRVDYVKVNLETVFCKGQIFAPLLHQSRLRDEAFGKFWVAFSS